MNITDETYTGEDASTASLPSLPLSCAVLCVDCDRITVSYNDACPVCGGKSLLNVAQILGGTLGPERVRPSQPRIEMTRCA
jgi:hypothetical protein